MSTCANEPHFLSRDRYIVFDSYQFEKVTNAKIVILTVAAIFVRVLLDVCCSCV